MKLALRNGKLEDQERGDNVRKWVDFVALLLLSFTGVIGSFLTSRGAPIPNNLILLLFGTGIISSVILIKTKPPFEKGQKDGPRRHAPPRVQGDS